MAARVACTLAFVEHDGINKITMIKEYGKWNFVTEHVEDVEHETYREAAIRGVKEEMGCLAELTGYLGVLDTVYTNKWAEDEAVTIMIFTAELLPTPYDGCDDTTEEIWPMSIEKIEALPDSELRFPKLVRFALERLKEGKNQPLDEVGEIAHI